MPLFEADPVTIAKRVLMLNSRLIHVPHIQGQDNANFIKLLLL